LLLLGPVGLALAGGGVPGLIYMKAGSRVEPAWISAQEATEKGVLRWRLFSEADQRKLRGFLADSERLRAEQKVGAAQSAAADCPLVLSASEEERTHPKPNGSLSDLDQQALAIYRGRIESISPGFFDGLPYSLLQVEVTDALRSSELVARNEILIPYPFAQFKIGSSTFCGGDPRKYRPTIGDEVLVFVYDTPLNSDRTLVYPRSPEIFFQTAEGHLIVPEALRTDKAIAAASRLEDLEKLVRSRSPSQLLARRGRPLALSPANTSPASPPQARSERLLPELGQGAL
jgi:hypothetical protein